MTKDLLSFDSLLTKCKSNFIYYAYVKFSRPDDSISVVKPPSRLSDLMPVNRDLRNSLKGEFQRTGLSARLLLKGRKDIPAGLDVRVINGWITGTAREASALHILFVLRELAAIAPAGASRGSGEITHSQPSATPANKIVITPCMRDHLRAEFRRTGTTGSKVARLSEARTVGLTQTMIAALSSGDSRTIAREQWDVLNAYLSGLPDREIDREAMEVKQSPGKWKDARPITLEEFEALTHERERTGVGGHRLLAYAENPPPGLTPAMIGSWISQVIRSASSTHLEYVLSLYRTLPSQIRKRGMPWTGNHL